MFGYLKSHKKSLLTILLEIIIVFIGISISLWIDDWNQNRKDRLAEKEYLKSLYFDISMDVQDLSNRHFDAIETYENIQKILYFLNYPDSVEVDREYFQQVMGRSQLLQNFAPTDYTFQEMTSTGKLSLIKDDELRKKLTMYYSIVRRMNEDKASNNTTTRQLLFNGVLDHFHVARLFSFGNFSFSRLDDTLDLKVFRDRESKKFVVIQNYLLLRAAMMNKQAGDYQRILLPLLFLKDEIAKKIGIPTIEDFKAEILSGKPASKVFEEYSENSEFRYVKMEFNQLVYELIPKHPDKSLEVALLNIEIVDDDSNLYDSLGDAYAANGDDKKALENYRKAIEMNIFQIETREKIKKIENK